MTIAAGERAQAAEKEMERALATVVTSNIMQRYLKLQRVEGEPAPPRPTTHGAAGPETACD